MTVPIAAATILAQAFRIMEIAAPSSFADTSEKAAAALEQYPRARDMALEAHDWSFARRVATLPPLVPSAPDIADPDLPHTMALPGDCLVLRHVYGGDSFAWRIDGEMLRSARPAPLTIRYTYRHERENRLPQTFQLVIAYQLALLLAPRFVTTRTKSDTIRDEMSDAVRIARTNDQHSASHHRMDGTPEPGDWASEARQ